MRLRIKLAYDGRQFEGWQVQPGKRTVQGELEEALSLAYDRPLQLTGAGRTDSGVHATGQVAHFDIENPRIPPERIVAALRRYCPPDILVYEASVAKPEFHACFDASARTYRYRFVLGIRWPHERGLVTLWPHPGQPDPGRVRETLAPLVGEHDFTSYTLVDQSARTRERRLEAVAVELHERYLDLVFTADGFLRRMIRMITGQLVRAWSEREPAAVMARVLAARDNSACAAPAPPDGLYLEQISYPCD